jgi:hypothetical protein
MRSILRSILAVFAAFVAACVVMMTIETINGHVLHPELGEAAKGMTDREAIRALLATAPVTAFLVVIFGWVLASFAGGWIAARIAARAPMVHALTLGGLITLGGIANNLMLPPPAWFWPASLILLLPAAHVGGRLAGPKG